MSGLVLVSDALREEAASVTSLLPSDEAQTLNLVLPDNETVPVSSELAQFLRLVLDGLATNAIVSVDQFPDVVSTTTAAGMLGISRPTLIKLARAGKIPSFTVGNRTRLRSDDVVRFREERAEEQRRAFDELRSLTDGLESD